MREPLRSRPCRPAAGRHPRRRDARGRARSGFQVATPPTVARPQVRSPRPLARAFVEAGLGLVLAALALFACALMTQTVSAG
jgi:hypothetical protein